MRFFLYPFSLLFQILVFFKNLCYNTKILKAYRLPCIVISVGNITTGGTGKTPFVIYLSNILKYNYHYKVAILSRGYGRLTKGTVLVSYGQGPLHDWSIVGDEPYMMSKKLKEIPIAVDENRFRGGSFLIKKYNPDIIILDDGFQHRSLYRDLDIVLLNGNDSKINYKLLPQGLLREPWKNIKRADKVFITKNNPNQFLLKQLKENKIKFYTTKTHSKINKSNYLKEDANLNFEGTKVFLLSGIGDPKSFTKTVSELNYNIVGIKQFPDHHVFKQTAINKLIELAKTLKTDYIITTEKDWVKLDSLKLNFSFIIVDIKIEIVEKNVLKNLINF